MCVSVCSCVFVRVWEHVSVFVCVCVWVCVRYVIFSLSLRRRKNICDSILFIIWNMTLTEILGFGAFFFFFLLLPLSSPLLSSPLQVTVFPPRWQAGFSVFSSTEMLRAPCQGEARAEPSQIFSVLLESPWGRRESKWGLFLSVDLHSVFSSKCSNMPSVDYCCRFSQWVRASIVFWITEHVSVHATIFMKKLFTISL